jgi:hypothetical protein
VTTADGHLAKRLALANVVAIMPPRRVLMGRGTVDGKSNHNAVKLQAVGEWTLYKVL